MLSQKDIKSLTQAAKLYKDNLLNKNVMFVHYNKKMKKYLFTEMLFEKRHFLHLTGIDFALSTTYSKKSVLFYNKCISHKLSPNDGNYKSNGTTVLKLQIINMLMNIHKKAEMIGNYNNMKPQLIADKICGGVYASMAIAQERNQYYIPKSGLQDDLRNLVTDYDVVKVIFVKEKIEEKYSVMTKNKLGISLNCLPQQIKDKIAEALLV